MRHLITAVDKGSIAAELGVEPGFELLYINGKEVEDVFDFERAAASTALSLSFAAPDGEILEAEVEKDEYEPLGLNFSTGLMSPVRACKNRCIFCFIDQMPKGGRSSLHIKDDDWRLSFIMGNYITLTNVDDAEFERIISHRISPLYISVHATDGAVRTKMMQNPTAAGILQRLQRLKAEGLQFHCQVVVCPGINDGEVLENTLNQLAALRPAARSVALVPVGLTRHREGLFPLRRLTAGEAQSCIAAVQALNGALGKQFAFGADEMYITAGLSLPEYSTYGEFEQLENGVGLVRKFEHEFLAALAEYAPLKKKRRYAAACGVAVEPYLGRLLGRLLPYGIDVDVFPVQNDFFGHSVTVSGLVTAGDIIAQLGGRLSGANALLIPQTMLRDGEDVFLDGVTLAKLGASLGIKPIPMPAANGESFVKELFDL